MHVCVEKRRIGRFQHLMTSLHFIHLIIFQLSRSAGGKGAFRCCFRHYGSIFAPPCSLEQLRRADNLKTLPRGFPLGPFEQAAMAAMEVRCLNGMAVMVEPLECLQEAKVKVASALGVFPEAVRISCRGQILGGDFEALELCLAKLEMDAEI